MRYVTVQQFGLDDLRFPDGQVRISFLPLPFGITKAYRDVAKPGTSAQLRTGDVALVCPMPGKPKECILVSAVSEVDEQKLLREWLKELEDPAMRDARKPLCDRIRRTLGLPVLKLAAETAPDPEDP